MLKLVLYAAQAWFFLKVINLYHNTITPDYPLLPIVVFALYLTQFATACLFAFCRRTVQFLKWSFYLLRDGTLRLRGGQQPGHE